MLSLRKKQRQAALIQAGYRYACALNPDSQDAEDLVHDAWIRVVNRYGPQPDKPLLFRVIRNLYIDRYRRMQRLSVVEFEDERVSSDIDERRFGALEEIEDARLMAALDRLRDVEREVMFLSVVEGYTTDEIAALTEQPRGTCLSHAHRARKKLREWLTEDPAAPIPLSSAHRRDADTKRAKR